MNMQIFMIVLFIPIMIGIIAYIFVPRQTKNLAMKYVGAWKKRYVICHLYYQGGLVDQYLVVPNPQGLTQVGKYSYDLQAKYAILTWKNRLHFRLAENNVIPESTVKYTDEDIVFQAAEIQTALNNTVMEYLFSKKKDILIIGLFLIAIISIIAIIYNVYELTSIQETLKSMNQTNIGVVKIK